MPAPAKRSAQTKERNIMDWISVKDRLPCKRECVLTINGPHACCEISLYIDGGFHFVDDCRFVEVHGVTHWMPLPEPPKREGN